MRVRIRVEMWGWVVFEVEIGGRRERRRGNWGA